MAVYVSGMQALNIHQDDDKTGGDWHPIQDWTHLQLEDDATSPFGTWGIIRRHVPEHGVMRAASHPRACLDLINRHLLDLVQGMRETYISNEEWTQPIFEQVWKLHERDDWDLINNFVGYEYLMDWVRFLRGKNAKLPHGPKPQPQEYADSARPYSDESRQVPSSSKEHARRMERLRELAKHWEQPQETTKTEAAHDSPTTEPDAIKTRLMYAIRSFNRNRCLEDLQHICSLYTRHRDVLDDSTRQMLSDTIYYSGLDICDYLLATQGESWSAERKKNLADEYSGMLKGIGLAQSDKSR